MKWKTGRPDDDGEFIVTTESGRVISLDFTVDGGWNTFFDHNGCLINESEIKYVRGWIPFPKPMPEQFLAVEWGDDDE